MSRYSSFSDDYYVNMNLNTEMELPKSRDTILHFFEQMQKKFPTMQNFYSRAPGEFVLEEDKDQGQYRWAAVEPRRVLSVHFNPDEVEESLDQHRYVLDSAPYCLSMRPLDCESINLTYGFDYTYRGNHNQLIAEALGIVPAFERIAEAPGTTFVSYEPNMQFTWESDCRLQARLGVETRTTAYQIRTDDYPEEQFSIYLTGRRYGSLAAGESLVETLNQLSVFCHELLDKYVIENVLSPVKETIAIR